MEKGAEGARLAILVARRFREALKPRPSPEARLRDGKSVDGANTNPQKASSVPSNKPKKKQRCEGSDADFLEKQKAYFEEVDAFELPVEFVTEKDLE